MNETKGHLKIELLRITPPLLNNNFWNVFDINKIVKKQTHENSLQNIDVEEETKEEGITTLSNDLSLCLQMNNKKIYLGQTLKSYINIYNNFKSNITIVEISVDVWIQQNAFNIYHNTNQIILPVNGFFDFVTSFLVHFLEVFSVRCEIEYMVGIDKKRMKKSFDFISKNPFRIKSSVHQREDQLYMQVKIKNTEEDSIMLNDISLKGIQCELIRSNEFEKVYKGIYYFKPDDEYILLFNIEEGSKEHFLNCSNYEHISNIEIKYFTSNGGKGIINLNSVHNDINTNRVHVYLKYPKEISFETNKMYELPLVFENNTSQIMELEIFIHNSDSIYVLNHFVKNLCIEGGSKKSHTFYVRFIASGVHYFNKISIYNKVTKRKIQFVKHFRILVT